MKLLSLSILTIIINTFFFPINQAFANADLQQTTDLVQANNKFVTLLGTQVYVGEKAPNFKVVDDSFSPVTLQQFTGKNLLISVVPSLDTGICSLQTKRFNEEVVNLSNDTVMLTISNDLPFAQKRFCKTENIDDIKILSDAVWRDFGSKYGLLIKDMGLLTRAIFIIDSQGNIAYKELVANISQHPDYEVALDTLKALSSIEIKLKNKEIEPALDKIESKTTKNIK
ncbi:MAG: thiol peroxidase [Alteromonadaceae bacterium]|jgi:thiol peroxidase